MSRPSALAILFSLLGSSLAAAQECRGSAPLERPFQFSVGTLFAGRARSYAAGLAVGGTGAFGELRLGEIDVSAFDVSSFTLGGAAGLQVPMHRRGGAHLCPIAEVQFVRDPTSINGSIDYRRSDFSLGVTAGVMTSGTAHGVKILPTASLAYENASSKLISPSGSVSSAAAFAFVSVGVGFLVGDEMSITPSVSNAFWVKHSSTTVGIRIAFVLGGVRPMFVASRPTSCAGLAPTDSTVHDTTHVSERANLRSAPEPRYPLMDRDLAIGGRVVMDVIVGADGIADQSSVQVIQHVDPGIDREALRWIGTVTYWPACRDGRPVRARLVQPLDFCVAGCRQGKS